jgi:hypothetical protein
MTDDLVKRLRLQSDTSLMRLPENHIYVSHEEAADRIEQLERALLDVAQYTSSVDMCHYVEPETRKVLNGIGEKKDER